MYLGIGQKISKAIYGLLNSPKKSEWNSLSWASSLLATNTTGSPVNPGINKKNEKVSFSWYLSQPHILTWKHKILSKILLLINSVYSIRILKMLYCIDAEKEQKV